MFSVFMEIVIMSMAVQAVFGETNYCNGTLLDGLSVRAICDYNGRLFDCPQRIAPETSILLNCAFGYLRTPKTLQSLTCLSNGSFDKTPERCEQYCGHISGASKTPWHVAIYGESGTQHNYRCGGSIISPTVVISAAHCFWDEANQLLDRSIALQVVAGPTSRNYSTEQTEHSQIVRVREVYIPQDFRGRDELYRHDIALLRLAQPLKYSETIKPVCFPKPLRNSASKYMRSNNVGFVSIFGKTDQLEQVRATTVAYHDCVAKGSLADDKFCAYATDGDAAWTGNSGAGFLMAVTNPITSTVDYQFRGVLSHFVHPEHEGTRSGDLAHVAINDIFSTSVDFQRKVLSALKEDEALN